MRGVRWSSYAAILFAVTSAGFAAAMTLIGEHPVSTLTAYPNIHSLTAYQGRIYFGHGDYNDYPVNVIVSYAPKENVFRLEHSTGTDATDLFRVLDGKLFAPSVDPVHYEGFRDFSYYTPGVGWRDMAPVGAFHLFDAAQLGDALFICGARDIAEGVGNGRAALMRSTDGGRSWSVVSAGPAGRYYWCFALGARVWTQGGYYEGSTFTASAVLGNYNYLYKAMALPAGFAVALRGRSPTGSGQAGTLVTFDGASIQTLATGVLDFAWDGTELYQLTATGIFRATGLTATSATWVKTNLTPPPTPRALEVHDGTAYVASGAKLYAARLDGAAFTAGAPTVRNELPDSFGRGLALDGDRLVVGAPDAGTAAVPLSGSATVWDAPKAGSGAWRPAEIINPPQPDCSGWFGKDVALRGDLLAIVESGYDTTNKDRGSAARVHVYQLAGGKWVGRAVLAVPFAHSALFDENMLLVGTGNPAANQASGVPGVNSYLVTRDAQNVAAVNYQTQVRPVATRYGYKPIARVARAEDRLIAGLAGDPSRNGGRGLVSVWKKSAEGSGWIPAPVQEFTAAKEDRYDQFGFAVAAHEAALAVGAPRDDTAAPQAGAVYLYTWKGEAYVRTQIISSPVAQAEAGFGSAVAMKGNTLLIGAPGVTVGGTRHAGAVYLYEYNGKSWNFSREIKPPAASLAEFGIEVAIGGRWLAAGSRFAKPDGSLTARVAIEALAAGAAETEGRTTQ